MHRPHLADRVTIKQAPGEHDRVPSKEDSWHFGLPEWWGLQARWICRPWSGIIWAVRKKWWRAGFLGEINFAGSPSKIFVLVQCSLTVRKLKSAGGRICVLWTILSIISLAGLTSRAMRRILEAISPRRFWSNLSMKHEGKTWGETGGAQICFFLSPLWRRACLNDVYHRICRLKSWACMYLSVHLSSCFGIGSLLQARLELAMWQRMSLIFRLLASISTRAGFTGTTPDPIYLLWETEPRLCPW